MKRLFIAFFLTGLAASACTINRTTTGSFTEGGQTFTYSRTSDVVTRSDGYTEEQNFVYVVTMPDGSQQRTFINPSDTFALQAARELARTWQEENHSETTQAPNTSGTSIGPAPGRETSGD